MSVVRGGKGSGGDVRPCSSWCRTMKTAGVSRSDGADAPCDGIAIRGAHAREQAMAFEPSLPPAGQAPQSPCPEAPMSDAIAIFVAMPLA